MGGGSREPDGNPGIPSLMMAAEHYNWIVRLLDHADESDEGGAGGEPVKLEIDVRARFHDRDTSAYNTIAEIPGSEPGLVMVGAHLDSWHAGTGATDNAAGCAVAMEAVRILKKLGVRPRRTIRIGLWSGEEQGLLGSRAYVAEHLATVPRTEDPEQQDLPPWMRDLEGEVEVKPAHETFSAYFNLDNGSGKIRGIWGQENAAAVPIFSAWLEPFHDLGADTVTTRNTRGTDHQAYDRVGLPGFQFIQDGLDYFSRTHHTNFDVLDHAVREDLMQASVVMASFLYHAAMRDEPLPRKPMPVYEKEEKPKAEEDDG
jgi:Zn-dependent M28 family amino/carboxypeptidase